MTQASIVQRLSEIAPDGLLGRHVEGEDLDVLRSAKSEILRLEARVKELEKALYWFLVDDRFQVSVGGNPDVVEKMLSEAITIIHASSYSLETE